MYIVLCRNLIPAKKVINALALQEVERVMQNHASMEAFITVDEMKIKENLIMKYGKVEGFVEWEINELATHIIVFYLRSIKKEISMPIAWWPTKVTPASRIALMFWKIVCACEKKNVHINCVIADGYSINRKFFHLVSLTKFSLDNDDCVYTAPNPYSANRAIFLCLDPSHLIKTIRNSFYASRPGGSRYLNMLGPGHDILWEHVAKLYEMEKSMPLTSITKLTSNHIQLTPFSKMNVKLAKDVLSHKVAEAISAYVEGGEGTAEFIRPFSRPLGGLKVCFKYEN
ncbi:uncharacterized protein LOC144747713 [Ciona intestinalis]